MAPGASDAALDSGGEADKLGVTAPTRSDPDRAGVAETDGTDVGPSGADEDCTGKAEKLAAGDVDDAELTAAGEDGTELSTADVVGATGADDTGLDDIEAEND